MATKAGTVLRQQLNDALHGSEYIGWDRADDCALLSRRAKRYAKRQENACTYEWAQGDKWDRDEERLEASIRELAKTLPGVKDVIFSGDPRGYCVKLVLTNGRYNNMGGEGFGIA